MNTEQLLAEMRETNLTYLTLAQNLIREDMDDAVSQLGLSNNSAGILSGLSSEQLLKLASGNTLLCRFRIDDEVVFDLLTSHKATGRMLGSVLTAERIREAA